MSDAVDGGNAVDAADEGRHASEKDVLWNESWYFDFATADGSLGGYVRLGLYPNQRTAWYWAYLVGDGRPLVAVRDHEVAIPKGRTLEVRAEGLWAQLVCETALEHWSLGLEAFGVALDDPADAYRGERGDRTALGLDLEWEAVGPAQMSAGLPRYEQACEVHGEVLVGDERLAVDGWGERDHSWGPRDWWVMPWCWTAGHLSGGTAFHAFRPLIDIPFVSGFVLRPGREIETVERFEVHTELGPEGLPTAATMGVGDLELRVTPLHHAPVLLTSPEGKVSRFPRSLCRFELADESGWGWTEWNQPPAAGEVSGGA